MTGTGLPTGREGGHVDSPTRVLLGGIYPMQAACTRLRLGVVRDAVQDQGFDARMWTFLRDADFQRWLGGGLGQVIASRRAVTTTRDLRRAIREAEIAVVQRELLPFNSAVAEKGIVQRGTPMIWDVDDALWITEPGLRGRVRGDVSKYSWLARNATEIWAGSSFIADWCTSQGAANVHYVPTLPPQYPLDGSTRQSDLLVWIGTAATERFLVQFLSEFGHQLSGWRLTVVGGRVSQQPGIDITCLPWSVENERAALQQATVGLYPIDTSVDYAQGKAGLKALLYMAHGVPLLGTDALAVRNVYEPGCGFLVTSQDDVKRALSHLSDPTEWEQLSRTALMTYAQKYDRDRWSAWIRGRLKALA